MAQRAIININGDLIPFSEDLDRIRTPGLGGSAVTWVPDADTICDQLKVTANGTYSAAEAGKYGYDYVVVSVPGSSVTGRDPDTGEEVEVHPDPETGEIVTTVLPTEIRVITPPAKTDYADGETIDYSGIVVHAYSSKGTDLGAVPFGELVFPVTTAHSESGQSHATSDLDTGAFMQPIPLSGVATFAYTQTNVPVRNTHTWTPVNGAAMVIRRNTESSTVLLFAAKQAGEAGLERHVSIDEQTGEQRTRFSYTTADLSYTHDGKTVYYQRPNSGHATGGLDILVNPVVSNYGDDNHDKAAAWTAIYGTIIGEDQSLPVQWPRTPDGAVLETTFSINVTGGST